MLNPLAFLMGMFTPSPSFGEIQAAVKPNPYAPNLPNQAAQARPSLSWAPFRVCVTLWPPTPDPWRIGRPS